MDIYGQMCFTVSSGWRPAWGSDGAHSTSGIPTPWEFNPRQAENGGLRQFNLLALVTDDFMRQFRGRPRVEALAFPLRRRNSRPTSPISNDTSNSCGANGRFHRELRRNEEGSSPVQDL